MRNNTPAKSSKTVGVRLSGEIIKRVERVMDPHGTVSGWCRAAVLRDLERIEKLRKEGYERPDTNSV